MLLRQIDFIIPKHGEGFSSYGLYCLPYGAEIIRHLVQAFEPSIQVRIIDETRGDKIDFGGDAMFGTSFSYPIKRLYEVAKAYRERGKRVVLGGIHVSSISSIPEITAQEYKNADAIVIGEGESVIPELITDLKADKLKSLYFGRAVGTNFPVLSNEKLGPAWGYPIQFLRGCPWGCEFCSVPNMFGDRYRQRPVSAILQEIEHYHQTRRKSNFLFAVDDDINDPKTIYPVLEAIHQQLGPVQGGWSSATDMNLVVNFKGEINHRFLSLASKTNCVSLFFGFENVNPRILKEEIGVKKNSPKLFPKLAKACHDYGITIFGSTIISQMSNTWEDIEFMVDWYNSIEIDFMIPNILTPLPGTPLFNKLYREQVIYPANDKTKARKVSWLDLNWSKYDNCHVVWMPDGARHTAEEYQEMYEWFRSNYQKKSMKSLAWAAYRIFRGDLRSALYRHLPRAFVGLKQSGVIPNKFVEWLFFSSHTR